MQSDFSKFFGPEENFFLPFFFLKLNRKMVLLNVDSLLFVIVVVTNCLSKRMKTVMDCDAKGL